MKISHSKQGKVEKNMHTLLNYIIRTAIAVHIIFDFKTFSSVYWKNKWNWNFPTVIYFKCNKIHTFLNIFYIYLYKRLILILLFSSRKISDSISYSSWLTVSFKLEIGVYFLTYEKKSSNTNCKNKTSCFFIVYNWRLSKNI